MKKILSSILVVMFVLLVASTSYAITPVYGGSVGMGNVKTIVLVNSTTNATSTFISTSYVVPGKCLILGQDIAVGTHATATAELVIALADATPTTGDADNYLLSEAEYPKNEPAYKAYPGQGLRISRQLQVRQGANTVVTIYYVQDRP